MLTFGPAAIVNIAANILFEGFIAGFSAAMPVCSQRDVQQTAKNVSPAQNEA